MKSLLGSVALFSLLLAVSSILACGDEKYTNSNLPKLPNWAERNYQIALSSISPDQNWAILVPKDPQLLGNLLIHLPDFTHSLDLPIGAVFPDPSREYGLVVNWAKNSSAAVAYLNGKFGAENVFIIVPGSPGYIIDLDHEIRREMQPDFVASKALGWNENVDYYLSGNTDESWTFNEKGQVIVNCQGDDNPRAHPGLSWQGDFRGIYDIREEKFIVKKYERIFVGIHDQQ